MSLYFALTYRDDGLIIIYHSIEDCSMILVRAEQYHPIITTGRSFLRVMSGQVPTTRLAVLPITIPLQPLQGSFLGAITWGPHELVFNEDSAHIAP